MAPVKGIQRAGTRPGLCDFSQGVDMGEGTEGGGELSTDRRARTQLSRRAFLVRSGAGAAALMLDQPLLAAADDFEPVISMTEDGVIDVDWGGKHWLIRSEWFSSPRGLKLIDSNSFSTSGKLAGTSIRANFKISKSKQNDRWGFTWKSGPTSIGWIAAADWFRDPAQGDTAGIPVLMKGSFTAGKLRINSSGLGVLIKPPFSLETVVFSTARSFTFRVDGIEYSGAAQMCRVDPPGTEFSDVAQVILGNASLSPGYTVAISQIQAIDKSAQAAWNIGPIGRGAVALTPVEPMLIVETSRSGAGHVYRRESLLTATMRFGESPIDRSIRLDNVSYVQTDYRGRDKTHKNDVLRARIADDPVLIQGDSFAAFVRGKVDAFFSNVAGSKSLEFLVEMLSFHPTGLDCARYDVDFRTKVLDGPDLDSAAIGISRKDNRYGGVLAVLSIGYPPQNSVTGINTLHLGIDHTSNASVMLHRDGANGIKNDSPVLRVRRDVDGLDIGFTFYDYRLIVQAGKGMLVPGPQAQRGVRFHPQHLQEEVFTTPIETALRDSLSAFFRKFWSSKTTTEASECGVKPVIRQIGEFAYYGNDGGPATQLARTRVSGPSRLVFARTPDAKVIDLGAESLTMWDGLHLSVSPRAVGDLPLEDQLSQIVEIQVDTPRDQAIKLVKASLVNPGADQTALELVTGLTFSPDNSARFRTPHIAPEGGRIAVWTAQLELSPLRAGAQPESRVRAIWAKGFNPESLLNPNCPPNDGRTDPFATSVDPQDRSELMMQTSAFGLGALRAVTLNGEDVSESLVRMPKGGYIYLDPKTVDVPGYPTKPVPQIAQEGVMIPAPFSRFGARLTAFGADIDVEWHGEPAAPIPNNGFFNRAFSVEQYLHRTSLRTDVFVEVVYKGFLFPYGFRVSLIKVTERSAYSVKGLGPMMPSIQRLFILPKPVSKHYPGIYQPFAGLDVPVRIAKLVGGLSPELDPHDMEAPPGLILPTLPPEVLAACPVAGSGHCREPLGRVFWPRARGNGGQRISFDFEADSTGIRRSVPMLFVDNAAVHHEPTVKAIVDYYNGLPWLYRREQHHGGRTIFAVPAKTGDTSFDTDSIVLAVRGRLVTVDQANAPSGDVASGTGSGLVESFQMDAFMEGADEPPFYPVMLEALISVPPLDRLLGAPQGLKRVGFNGNYVRNGFLKRGNPSELYLNFLDSAQIMQLGGRGDLSGGLVQTPTPIAGISRSNAIVGGAPLSQDVQKAIQRSSPPVGVDDRTPWDLGDVEAGQFNPGKFFKLGKLLGILDLGEVAKSALINAQPQLTEAFEYAADAEAGAIIAIREACAFADKVVTDALGEAEASLYKMISAGLPPGSPITLPKPGPGKDLYPMLRSFYPGLLSSILLFADSLQNVGNDASSLPLLATTITQQWNQIRGQIDAIVENPSPAFVGDILRQIREVLDAINHGLTGLLEVAMKAAFDQLMKFILQNLADAISSQGLFEPFFGQLPPNAVVGDEVEKILKNPSAIRAEVRQALLAEAFTIPLLQMLGDFQRIIDQPPDAAESAIDQIAEAATNATRSMLNAIFSLQSLTSVAEMVSGQICSAASATVVAALDGMAQLVVMALPSTPELANGLAVICDRAEKLGLPDLTESPEVTAARESAAGLRVAMQRLASQAKAIEVIRASFVKPGDFCVSPATAVSAAATLLRCRASSIEAISDCVTQTRLVMDRLQALPVGAARQAVAALGELRRELAILAHRFTAARLQSEVTIRYGALPSGVKDRLTELQPKFDAEMGRVSGLASNEKIESIKDDVTAAALVPIIEGALALLDMERKVVSIALDFTVVAGRVLAETKTLIDEIVTQFGGPLLTLHVTVRDDAKRSIDLLAQSPDIVVLLTGPLQQKLMLAHDAIAFDTALLQNAMTQPDKVKDLVNRWRSQQPGLVSAVQTIAGIFAAVSKGQLGAIFNLAAARRAIEDVVRRLIPSKIKLNYVWDTELSSFPSSNPIFVMPGTALRSERDYKDLKIETLIDVDLLEPSKRKVQVKGRIQPFNIKLLGESPWLVTIQFTDTYFTIEPGSDPHFNTRVAGAELGDALQFLSAISSYFGGGGDDGFHVMLSINPPGVKAGYYFHAPSIDLVGVEFLNVALEASVLLPFTDQQALFRFAFASRERPFLMVVAPCYAGGGFVSLMANARGIVAFEIQLEFGAAVAIDFGPLHGQGWVSSGIYLFAQQDGGRLLEGFVHAVGEGQIACFGMAVNIEVKIISDGTNMSGSSTYKVSFRVGFVTVSYSFKAAYKIVGGGQKAQRVNVSLRGDIGRSQFPPSNCAVKINAPDKMSDWSGYRKKFVKEWI